MIEFGAPGIGEDPRSLREPGAPRRVAPPPDAAAQGRSSPTIPAPTVSLVASSIRMKLPVRRLAR